MITVCTLATDEMWPVWELAARLWVPYCERHGYRLHVYRSVHNSSLHPSWDKLNCVVDQLHESSVVWWIDADMTVCKPELPLESIMSWAKPISVAQDWNGFCFAMFRAESSGWTTEFLKSVLLIGDVRNSDRFGKGLGCKWEQNSIKLLAEEFPNVAMNISTLPPHIFCDQPQRPNNASFYHFGGRTNKERVSLIRKLHNL